MERHLVIDHLKLSYEGLCNAPELFSLVQEWFHEKGWDWHEKTNQEIMMVVRRLYSLCQDDYVERLPGERYRITAHGLELASRFLTTQDA